MNTLSPNPSLIWEENICAVFTTDHNIISIVYTNVGSLLVWTVLFQRLVLPGSGYLWQLLSYWKLLLVSSSTSAFWYMSTQFSLSLCVAHLYCKLRMTDTVTAESLM